MADENVVDEIITNFFINTCRVCPNSPSRHAVLSAICEAKIAAEIEKGECIPLTTGSAAELYIEPMLSCIGDIDVMYHVSTDLAIPVGQQPPVNLPEEFGNYVKVAEIIDSHLPGYVYLKLQYFLKKCSNDGKYIAVKNNLQEQQLAALRMIYKHNSNECAVHVAHHGPAVLSKINIVGAPLPVDMVPCVRCLSWPLQAINWPRRHRNYGWPDSETVDRVVNNGCDVVHVAHRQCRQDEWMSKYQWRLSFSRAEIALLKSWLPVQQIVYHMLRLFAKTECLTDSSYKSGLQTLSNYHIKTLMLWECELKPRYWWTGDLNLVRISLDLLHSLAIWLNDVQIPHYFVENCSLIDNSFDAEMTAGQLMSLDRVCLSAWLLNKYLRKCSQLCSSNVSLLFDDANTIEKLQTAVSVIVNRRLHTAHDDLPNWRTFIDAEINISYNLPECLLSARSCACALSKLAKIDIRLYFYFTSAALLLIAQKILKNNFDDDLVDMLAATVGQYVHRSKETSSVIMLMEAVKLLSNVANKSLSTLQMIKINLSKAYLYRLLKCTDAYSDSIYCLANVYLAVLDYTTGNYQTAIEHCTHVTRSHYLVKWQCKSYFVQGKLLPKIDDNIDNVLGLCILYQYLIAVALKQQQGWRIDIFTTGLFAHYLQIKCLSAKECRDSVQLTLANEILRCRKSVADAQQLAICDVLIVKLEFIHNNVNKCQKSAAICQTVPDLVELLQLSAVKYLTTYRKLEARDFGSVVTIVTSDFEALYAYKRGDYSRCLQLCTQNVPALFNTVPNCDVMIFPWFFQLLDDDMVSLISLILVASYKGNSKMKTFSITQLTLLLYLMTQCQLKLHHSVTSLTQTLPCLNIAKSRHSIQLMSDQLTLKLIECKVLSILRVNI